MRRRQIEVIRYRRVTVIGGSDREPGSANFAARDLARQKVLANEVMDIQRCTRGQRLAISGQRLLNQLRRRRGNHSAKVSTIDRDPLKEPK